MVVRLAHLIVARPSRARRATGAVRTVMRRRAARIVASMAGHGATSAEMRSALRRHAVVSTVARAPDRFMPSAATATATHHVTVMLVAVAQRRAKGMTLVGPKRLRATAGRPQTRHSPGATGRGARAFLSTKDAATVSCRDTGRGVAAAPNSAMEVRAEAATRAERQVERFSRVHHVVA